MTRYSQSGFLPVILFLLTACSADSGSRSGHSFRTFTEDGITIAESSSGPKYEGELFNYEEVLRLKQDERVIGSLLTSPRRILIDQDGAFYVEDGQVNRIARFDASGTYTYDIGRQGEGPGEYLFPRLDCFHGDQIVIRDINLNRISWFNRDGTFVDSSPLPPRSEMVVQRFCLGPREERILLGNYQRGFGDAYRFNTAVFFVYSAENEFISSVSSDSTAVMRFFRVSDYRTSGAASIYFSASPRVLYHPDHGLVMTSGKDPVFRCYTLDGRLQREIHQNRLPESVSRAEKEIIRSYLRDRINETDNDRSRIIRQKQLELAEFQDPKACFTIRHIDTFGYIWAHTTDSVIAGIQSPNGRSARYQVFSPEGEYLGDTGLGMRWAALQRGHVVSIEENEETGAYEVVLHRITSAIDGFHYPE